MVTNFNLMPDGQISITVETVEERRALMQAFSDSPSYAEDASSEDSASDTRYSETEIDAMREAYFRKGWDACANEAKLRYVSGTLEEFFQETGVSHETIASWTQTEPEETATTPEELPLQTGVARPATDSGEPEKEGGEGPGVEFGSIDGVWTISDDELQVRLKAEYDRGYEDGDREGRSAATYNRKIKKSAVQVIAHAVAEYHTKRSIADIVEATVRQLGFEVEL